MSYELWVEGVILEFRNSTPCDRAIIRSAGNNEVILADIATGAIINMTRATLDSASASGEVKLLAESRDHGELKFIDLTETEQRETNRRYQYIKKIQECGISKVTEKSAKRIIGEVAQTLEEKAPHWQSVREWYKRYVGSGRKMRGLYPYHRRKGRREPRLDPKVLEIINKEASRYYKLSQPTMASIRRNIEDKVIQYNLDHPEYPLVAPSYLTVQSRVLKVNYQTRQKARKGARAFQEELLSSKSGIESTKILDRVEIDHTLLDIHVLHDDLKTLLGRPNITVLIDHYSHMVLGLQLSFEKPSYASVCMACMNAFLPKAAYLEDAGCHGEWPAHGIPCTLVTDNGNEFWGKSFGSVADELGSDFQYCPIRKGNYKSRVERFFGTINSMVLDDLPGVVRKPGKSGDGYDARQEAKLTYSELKRYLLTWITEVYHNLPIEGTGMTPKELWSASEVEHPVPVECETELTPILMATATRELGKGGIRIFVLDYNSAILKDIYRRDGPVTLTIKYNPFDIGYILVLDKVNKVYIKVDCENYAYASGLSVFEHQQVRATARSLGKSKLDSLDLQRARVKLSKERERVHEKNSRRKTQVTASNAARTDKIGVNELKLVVNNSKQIIQLDQSSETDDLIMGGWSVEQ